MITTAKNIPAFKDLAAKNCIRHPLFRSLAARLAPTASSVNNCAGKPPQLTRLPSAVMRSAMTADRILLEPGLYVTATPIGNLGDITYRAVETLKASDLILCEDTRQTAKLCAAYEIKTPRAPYHDHNAAQVRPNLIKKLQDGARICLVSDAGTPLISDPGYKLVCAARAANRPANDRPR